MLPIINTHSTHSTHSTHILAFNTKQHSTSKSQYVHKYKYKYQKMYIIIEWLTFGEYACLILSISFSNIHVDWLVCSLLARSSNASHEKRVSRWKKCSQHVAAKRDIQKATKKIAIVNQMACVCIGFIYMYECVCVCAYASTYLVQGFVTSPPLLQSLQLTMITLMRIYPWKCNPHSNAIF